MGFLGFPLQGGGGLYLEVDDDMGDHVADGADDLGLRSEVLRLAVGSLRSVSPKNLGKIADLIAESGIMSAHRPQLDSPQVLQKAQLLLSSAGHLDSQVYQMVLVDDTYWHINGVSRMGVFSLYADKTGAIYHLSVVPVAESAGPAHSP